MSRNLSQLVAMCDGPVQVAINSWKDHFPNIEAFLMDAMLNGVVIDPIKERLMCQCNTVVEVYYKPKCNGDLVGVLHYDVELAIQQAIDTLF